MNLKVKNEFSVLTVSGEGGIEFILDIAERRETQNLDANCRVKNYADSRDSRPWDPRQTGRATQSQMMVEEEE